MRVLRISRLADEDIVDILSRSLENFGAAACRRYEALLTEAFNALCNNPEQRGSVTRPGFGDGIRTYHLRFSRDEARTEEGIVHRPRHVIVYRDCENRELEIVRVLHDGMELRRHLPGPTQHGRNQD